MKSMLTFAGLLLAAGSAMAQASFGSLPAATFNGNGIPNNAVAQFSQDNVTIGLTAHGRFGDSPVGNNGAGTFSALTGVDTNAPSTLLDPYAEWNFGYYIGGTAANVGTYTFVLTYDFNPASGNTSDLGSIIFPGSIVIGDPSLAQNSWNLGMNFLAANSLGITAPTFTPFDPNAVGEYSFTLTAIGPNSSTPAFSTSILVVTSVPEPGEWAMMIAGLGVVGFAAKRRRSRQTVSA